MLYVAQNTSLVKIGYSTHPKRRLRHLRGFSLIATYTEFTPKMEQEVHELLKAHRVGHFRETYYAGPHIVAAIETVLDKHF